MDAASAGLGVALVSERLSQLARQQGLLLPLSSYRVKGPQWSMLVHQESEQTPQCRTLCHWLSQQFAKAAALIGEAEVARL
nr:LysR substrate-binding domain-containing protein [Aeromonas sp. sia0103]